MCLYTKYEMNKSVLFSKTFLIKQLHLKQKNIMWIVNHKVRRILLCVILSHFIIVIFFFFFFFIWMTLSHVKLIWCQIIKISQRIHTQAHTRFHFISGWIIARTQIQKYLCLLSYVQIWMWYSERIGTLLQTTLSVEKVFVNFRPKLEVSRILCSQDVDLRKVFALFVEYLLFDGADVIHQRIFDSVSLYSSSLVSDFL